jgi:hypothetical protein
MTEKIPSHILALGEQVRMTPIAWAETETTITIVFEQGPKIAFERQTSNVEKPAVAKPSAPVAAPVATPAAEPVAKPSGKRHNPKG